MFLLNSLPNEILLKISYEINSLKGSYILKLVSNEFNNLVDIPLNFKNKFLIFCENNLYDYTQINFKLFDNLDKNDCNVNNNSVDIWYGHATLPKFIVNCSIYNVEFDLMLPFSNMYKTTFKMYNKECPEKWLWYHSAVKYKWCKNEYWEILGILS